MTAPTIAASGPDEGRRLATYIFIDLVVVASAAAWMAALRLWLVPNPWMLVMVGLLLSAAAGLYAATVLVRNDRSVAAVTTFATANWAIAVTFAAFSPFAPTVLATAILLPVMLAVRYVRREQLSALLGAAVMVSAVMAAAGTLPDVFDIYAESPRRINDALAIVFVPAMSGLIALAAWQTHTVLAVRAETLRQSHARLVAAADHVRRRIERDLANATQPRIVAAIEAVQSARSLSTGDGGPAADVLERLTTDLQQASAELRELAHGIYPPELTEHGLATALRTAELRSPVPTAVAADRIGRYRLEIENNVYFCCAEALQNAARHGGPNVRVRISVQERNGLSFEVRDDGVGCSADVIRSGHGFTTMNDRIGAIGGSLTLATSPGRGVHLRGHIPLAVLVDGRVTGTHRATSAVVRALAAVWRLAARPWARAADTLTGRQHATLGIRTLLVVSILSGALILAGYPVASSAWSLATLGATGGAVLLLVAALAVAARGNVDRGLAVATVTFWAYAIAVTVLAPAALPYSSLLVVMPVVLAASRLRRQQFRLVVGASVAVSCLVTLAGRFPSMVDVEPTAYPPLHSIAFIALVILGTTVPSMLTWQNHVALTTRAEALQTSRETFIRASDLERRQIERNLHDCAQQRLVAAALHARVAHRLLSTQPEQLDLVLSRLFDDLREASSELRHLAQGMHSPRLVRYGLEVAVRAAAAGSPLPTVVTVTGLVRYRPDIESNVYFCCLEGLQNAFKHAGDRATVAIALSGDNGLSFDIRDDGAGCPVDEISGGHGFQNMRARLAAIGGSLTVDAEPGRGVHLHGHVADPALRDEATVAWDPGTTGHGASDPRDRAARDEESDDGWPDGRRSDEKSPSCEEFAYE